MAPKAATKTKKPVSPKGASAATKTTCDFPSCAVLLLCAAAHHWLPDVYPRSIAAELINSGVTENGYLWTVGLATSPGTAEQVVRLNRVVESTMHGSQPTRIKTWEIPLESLRKISMVLTTLGAPSEASH